MNSDLVDKLSNGDPSENGSDSKVVKIAKLIKEMLEIINPNAEAEIINKTPFRYAEAMLEFTQGHQENALETISEAIFDSEGYNDIIIVRDINFNSMCEHHLLPFFGECTIGYIPNKKILGLSKLPRLVQTLSKKLQIQERLTKEIAENIHTALNALGVVVIISSIHSCMCFRGIKSFNAKTETIFTLGNMKDKENLDKFFNLLRK